MLLERTKQIEKTLLESFFLSDFTCSTESNMNDDEEGEINGIQFRFLFFSHLPSNLFKQIAKRNSSPVKTNDPDQSFLLYF